MKTVLKVENISKTYTPLTIKTAFDRAKREAKAIHAVSDVSFEIQEGEIYGLLGPNGAGKSTIIKMITGLIRKDNGKIFVDGIDIDESSKSALSKIGAIIEMPSMFRSMTAVENLKYFAKLQGGVSDEDIKSALEIVGLSDRATDKAGTYSLGMKQRLGIAQAMMAHPKLLVLDEPTNGLDPEWIINTRELIKKLAKDNGVSVLVSSHILGEMQELCDRVGILYKGRLIEETNVEEIGKLSRDSKTIAAFTLDDIDRAYDIIKGIYDKVIIKKGKIYVELIDEEIASLNKKLVENDINIYGIEVKKRTLEDLFKSLVLKDNNESEISLGGSVNVR